MTEVQKKAFLDIPGRNMTPGVQPWEHCARIDLPVLPRVMSFEIQMIGEYGESISAKRVTSRKTSIIRCLKKLTLKWNYGNVVII